jgi:hypothetical protein
MTTAHVLDSSQIGALRQPGPHMLCPLVANVVAVQAGVRPPTQSVTHIQTQTQTEREGEATHKHTYTQGQVRVHREGRPKADTFMRTAIRTASAHVVRL